MTSKILILSIIILTPLLNSCEKDSVNDNSNCANNNFFIKINECCNVIDNYKICFDSVISDSRCPKNAYCIWEGNAAIKLIISKNNINHRVILNTNHSFTTDTVINDLYISLDSLYPYPELFKTKEYIAALTVLKLKELKSNAQVINFCPEKCSCCWGWTVKYGNDTIKSDSYLIYKKLGYCINHPIEVFIEVDYVKYFCNNQKYVSLKRIIPLE